MIPLTVAWISDFPIEWLPDAPDAVRQLPRHHPAMWEMVLLGELEKNPQLRLHIIALRSGIERSFSFQRNGVVFHILKYRSGTRLPSFYWVDTLLVRKALKQIQPDLVHAWGNEKGAGLAATRLKTPHLITVQGLFNWYRLHTPISMHDQVSVLAEKLSFSRGTDITVESRFAVQFVRQRYPHLRIHQIEHAPNWLFHRIDRQPTTAPVRFLTIGTAGARKGTDLLLKALNGMIPELDFRLAMIGNPSDAFLAPLRQSLSPDLWRRIEFKDHLSPAGIAAELSVATMLLFPTRVDNSPNAVKEAVVAGVPVVASDVGGIPDYVQPAKNGVLFKAGDLGEFTNAIRLACHHPLFRAGRVAPESLEGNRAYLSPARMGDRFLETYRSIATRASCPPRWPDLKRV